MISHITYQLSHDNILYTDKKMRWSCPGSFCPKRLCLRCLEDGSIQIKRHDWSLKTLCAIFCVVLFRYTWIFWDMEHGALPPACLPAPLIFSFQRSFILSLCSRPLAPFCTSFQIENVNLINFQETQDHRNQTVCVKYMPAMEIDDKRL